MREIPDPRDSPVLVIGFNRPESLKKIWKVLFEVKPRKIYFACDAARADKPGEIEKVQQVRDTVNQITWDCELKTNFQVSNQGCGRGPFLAMDWFFSQEVSGIILEDDCIPHPDFFPYCAELLQHYADDERIMTISGDATPIDSKLDFCGFSYGFSRFSLTWGWATWRRAWKTYSFSLETWPEVKEKGWLRGLVSPEDAYNGLHDAFEGVFTGRHSSVWDYQWTFNCLVQSGLSIIPSVNLISNIGFGVDATHTNDPDSPRAYRPTKELATPLVHPAAIFPWVELDYAVLFNAVGIRFKGWHRKVVKRLLGLPRDRKKFHRIL